MTEVYSQTDYEVRLEWAANALTHLAPNTDAVVIVDVLSFSTCVDVASACGALLFPYAWRDATAALYAAEKGALLAVKRGGEGFSLSPASLQTLPAGPRLVLPSPNGSSLTRLASGRSTVLSACLRNAPAVARYVREHFATVTVVPAGERWEDGGLRVALEDLLGAGALISLLDRALSPEAAAAKAAFESLADLEQTLKTCASGRELTSRGFERDVELAAAFGVSAAVPVLIGDAYINRGA